MHIEALGLAGLYLIRPTLIEDERGFFARSFSSDAMADLGLATAFAEWSISYNRKRGTLRGLHFQARPHGETKIVRCERGAVFDVAVDVRPDSPTFGRHVAVELSDQNRLSFYIAEGFAHGFQTLTDDAELSYHISAKHRPEAARGIRWDDPDIGVTWPDAADRVISARDRALPALTEWRTATDRAPA